MKSVLRATALLVAACALNGCQTVKTPVVSKKIDTGDTELFALTASRRLVFTQPENAQRKFCSEPPPDVAESFSESIRAAIEAAAKNDTAANNKKIVTGDDEDGDSDNSSSVNSQQSANASAQFARDLATAVSQIYTRSQGVQLFRDGSYMLCQAHLNKALFGDTGAQAFAKAMAERKANLKFIEERISESQANQEQRLSALSPGWAASSPEASAAITSAKAATKAETDMILRAARSEVKAADEKAEEIMGAMNYSAKFDKLLETVAKVLEQELPTLYRYDVEVAKNAAVNASGEATKQAAKASAAQAGAAISETNANTSKVAAATSATQAASSAKDAQTAARAAAEAASK